MQTKSYKATFFRHNPQFTNGGYVNERKLEAARKKAMDEVDGDDSWEKELDAKNRAKAGIDGPDAETLERNAERLKR